jgi:hypothetical protein
MSLGAISGILAFVVSILLLLRYQARTWAAAEQKLVTLFPGTLGQ